MYFNLRKPYISSILSFVLKFPIRAVFGSFILSGIFPIRSVYEDFIYITY